VHEKEAQEERKKFREALKKARAHRKEIKDPDSKKSPAKDPLNPDAPVKSAPAPNPPAKSKDAPADESSKKKTAPKKESADDEDEDDETGLEAFTSVAGQWGFKFGVRRSATGGSAEGIANLAPKATLTAAEAGLEETIPWHSALYFDDVRADWRILYLCNGKPVVIERPWGNGTMVLASDSFFLSNEALEGSARRPGFLSWLFQGHPAIVFDEEHLGLADHPGVATLLRKYQLHGFIAGLLLLGLLFVWENAFPFVPVPAGRSSAADAVAGRSSSEGLISLLRRSISPGQLLELCVAEWKKATLPEIQNRARVEATLASQKALSTRERDLVATYRLLTEAATIGKTSGASIQNGRTSG
jgi:hypothetical protein